MDSLLFKLDQEFLTSMGMVSRCLTSKHQWGEGSSPPWNHLSVAADIESGTCVGNMTIVTKVKSVEELAETMTFVKETSEEPQPVGKIHHVTSSDRAD